MLTERTTTLFVSIFYFQKCQTRDYTVISAYFATVSSRFRKMRTQSTVHRPPGLRCRNAAADTGV